MDIDWTGVALGEGWFVPGAALSGAIAGCVELWDVGDGDPLADQIFVEVLLSV